MSYQAQGAIVRIDETKQITEKFSKREFAIEIQDGKYPQTCLFQLTGDKCSLLDGMQIKDVVDVDFDLKGRVWTSPKTGEVKVFNSLDCWKLHRVSVAQTSEPQPAADADEDIPF